MRDVRLSSDSTRLRWLLVAVSTTKRRTLSCWARCLNFVDAFADSLGSVAVEEWASELTKSLHSMREGRMLARLRFLRQKLELSRAEIVVVVVVVVDDDDGDGDGD